MNSSNLPPALRLLASTSVRSSAVSAARSWSLLLTFRFTSGSSGPNGPLDDIRVARNSCWVLLRLLVKYRVRPSGEIHGSRSSPPPVSEDSFCGVDSLSGPSRHCAKQLGPALSGASPAGSPSLAGRASPSGARLDRNPQPTSTTHSPSRRITARYYPL